MGVEAVDAVRLLGQRGDRRVNRLADRLLHRADPTGEDGAGGPSRPSR